jgi:hypothetical protein
MTEGVGRRLFTVIFRDELFGPMASTARHAGYRPAGSRNRFWSMAHQSLNGGENGRTNIRAKPNADDDWNAGMRLDAAQASGTTSGR